MQNISPLLSVSKIVKTYPGVLAVDGASLELERGEIHGLVGENGAGKSTLVKILAGVIQPDEGQIFMDGEPLILKNGQDSFAAGFSFIHQELNLIPYLNAAENIFLGHPYPINSIGLISWNKLDSKAEHIFKELGVNINTRLPISQMSAGDQSMVAIARAFALDAQIYVMDEPTASLTAEEVENLFKVIKTLRSKSKTILYISHRLEEIFEITDRVTVMRDAKTVGTYLTRDLNKTSLISYMIGRSLEQYYPPSAHLPEDIILEAKNITTKKINNINFQLRAHEVLGIAGLVGSGRTELLHMLFGLDPILSGELRLFGKPFKPSSPSAAINQNIALVPEERRSEGLIMSHSITENIVLPHIKTLSTFNTFTNKKLEQNTSRKVSELVRLKAASVNHSVSTLSGGNQQKVVFGRWMVADVEVLLLDEPTRGVDVGARFEIYSLIRDMASKGAGIVLVSSDLEEIMGLSDRIIVMREGRMVADLKNENLTKYDILNQAYKSMQLVDQEEITHAENV